VTKEHRRASLSADRDIAAQLTESDRQRAKLEEEVRFYEGQVEAMRRQMDDLVSTLV
jgi:F0F1-type ATP synthase membrane subunit b/b'